MKNYSVHTLPRWDSDEVVYSIKLPVPTGTKSVTVTGSGKTKFQLLTRSGNAVGTGMVNCGTSTLFVDPESEVQDLFVRNMDVNGFDVYVHFNR